MNGLRSGQLARSDGSRRRETRTVQDAVLTGPGALGSGDQVALRTTDHPRARTFGRSTATAFNSPTGLAVDPTWSIQYAVADAYGSTPRTTTSLTTSFRSTNPCGVTHGMARSAARLSRSSWGGARVGRAACLRCVVYGVCVVIRRCSSMRSE